MPRRNSKPSGRVKSIVLGVLAIVAVTGSGLYILTNLNEERARLRPVEDQGTAAGATAGGPEPAPEGTDPLEVRSKVVIETSGGRPIVLLGSPVCSAPDGLIGRVRRGLMARELVRQAFLIAARDELGATTRDVVTGELARLDAAPTAMISSLFPRGKPARAFVRKGSGKAADGILEGDLGLVVGPAEDAPDDLPGLLERAEALSRGEFAGALKKLGLAAGSAAAWGDAAAPEGVDAKIDSLVFTEAFAAVRQIHAAIKQDGESPARLAALARAYALLGVLTEFQYRPAHKAYKARALLYAQRLAAKQATHPEPYWNRAFVWMMVGRPNDALADLEKATKRAETTAKSEPPVWVPVIAAAARHDVDELGRAPAAAAALASFLRLTLVECPATTTLTIAAAKDVLTKAPECYRAIDAMCAVEYGMSDLHVATALGPQVLSQTLAGRLRALPDPPAELAAAIDQAQGSFIPPAAALEAAGASANDVGELGWTALAGLIRETNFVQLDRRLFFMKDAWSVPVDEFWAAAEPSVADHPYKALLEWIVAAPSETGKAAARLVGAIDLDNLEISQHDALRVLAMSQTPNRIDLWNRVAAHLDHDSRDLGLYARDTNALKAPEKTRCARLLLKLDPRSDFARSILVEFDFDRVKDKIDDWAKEPNLAPELAAALGKRFEDRKDEARAVQLYERAAQLSPDRATVEKLAAVYVKKGDKDRWRKLLDDYIANGPDSGLDHAHFQVQIANQLMSEKKWDEAWPYAQAAAETWAGWALECAANCAEGREDWEAAEGYFQAMSQRYPNVWWRWYAFCKRTGRGNAVSALAFTNDLLKSIGDRLDVAAPEDRAYFHWLSGDYKTASTEFESLYASQKKLDDLFRAVMTADAAADPPRRAALYKQFRDLAGKTAPKTIQIWDQFLAAGDALKSGDFDFKPIDALVDSIPPENRWYTEFVVGQFLRNHGRPADALKYHKSCAKSRWAWVWIAAIANDSARGGASDLKSAAARPAAGGLTRAFAYTGGS